MILIMFVVTLAPIFALWLVSTYPSRADKATTEAVTREALRLSLKR